MNNNTYSRPYVNYGYTMGDQIDYQINQLQQMKKQMENNQQQPAINQTFQLAPTNNHTVRYANTIDDVNKETVYYDTPFFSKDMSVMWFKKANGEIKPYELNEIIPKDNKDLQIEYLQTQIEELKGMIKNDANVTNVDTKQNATDTTRDDKAIRTEPKSTKSSSVSKVSRSKKEQ